MGVRTRTYTIVTPYELYRCVLGMSFRVSNTEIARNEGIMLKLSNGIFEDDIVIMEYCDE